MQAGLAQGGLVSTVLFSVYVNDIPTPSRNVELAQYADETALVATSRAIYRFSSVVWRPTSVDRSAGYGIGGLPSTSQRALPCCMWIPRHESENPEHCNFSECQYSGSKLRGILGWPLIQLSGRRTSARWERQQLKDWACLASSLTGEAACPSETVCWSTSSSSVLWRIRHVCMIWRSATCSHVRKLHVLQSKCLRNATNALWCFSNRQIHEDLGIPFFADHTSALRVSTQSWLMRGTP
jgi:hypothetical protein